MTQEKQIQKEKKRKGKQEDSSWGKLYDVQFRIFRIKETCQNWEKRKFCMVETSEDKQT